MSKDRTQCMLPPLFLPKDSLSFAGWMGLISLSKYTLQQRSLNDRTDPLLM